jgi:hypothetical protein
MEKLPKIVDSMAMIGMIMSPDDRVDIADPGVQELLSKIGPGVDEDPHAFMLDEDGHAPPPVLGFCRIALAPIVADPRDARGGPAAENSNLHQAVAALPNKAAKLAEV